MIDRPPVSGWSWPAENFVGEGSWLRKYWMRILIISQLHGVRGGDACMIVHHLACRLAASGLDQAAKVNWKKTAQRTLDVYKELV